jgi:sulfide:quinone oxidoreductase
MDKKVINNDLSVSGQISTDDVATLKSEGVKSIICNRPDNEDQGQPAHDEIQKAAVDNGLEFHFMPVISGKVTLENGKTFGQFLQSLPKPIHAYCRSGTRCTTLWAIAQLEDGKDRGEILQQALGAGYNLSKTI